MGYNYKLTLIFEDVDGITEFSTTREGDYPNSVNFVNFCKKAAIAYGFSETQMEKMMNPNALID